MQPGIAAILVKQATHFCFNSSFCSKMARFRFSVNEKRGVGASRTQQQEQEQQRGDSEADSNTGLRPPLLPPALALPAFQGSSGSGNGLVRYETSEDNREELQELIYSLLNLRLHLIVLHGRTRLIQRYSGGELQFIIDWFEHIHRDLEEIRRELDSVEEELKRKPSA